MKFIYILKLLDNKYYIGKTNNINKRLKQHFANKGAQWTKKYSPIKIDKIIYNKDIFDEDKWTLHYMNDKGIHNVRGGSFSNIILKKEYVKTIERMLKSANDKCFICGSNAHLAKNCQSYRIKKI